MASADAAGPGELGEPTMEVVAPAAGSLAFAGEIYTVEVGLVSIDVFRVDD